jgi:hypothetical protein
MESRHPIVIFPEYNRRRFYPGLVWESAAQLWKFAHSDCQFQRGICQPRIGIAAFRAEGKKELSIYSRMERHPNLRLSITTEVARNDG